MTTSTAIPFICSRCGTHFGQNGIIFNGDFTGVELGQGHLNANARCPQCGTWNKPALPDGRYNIRNGRWEFIRQVTRDILSAQPTAEDVQRLAQVAREAKENGSDDEQIAAAIEGTSLFPELAQSIREFQRQHPPGWGSVVLQIILSVLMYLYPAPSPQSIAPQPSSPAVVSPKLSPQQLDQLARQIEEAIANQEPLNQRGSLRTPGRNEPCICGSGKKYKKCCGDPAERTAAKNESGPAQDEH